LVLRAAGKSDKARILAVLDRMDGKHLVLVKRKIDPANIPNGFITTPISMPRRLCGRCYLGGEGNRALLEHFWDRKIGTRTSSR
jgi:hypothetical protein